jgi:hypothetical protein
MKKDKNTNNDLQNTTHIQLKIFKLKIFKYNTKTTKNLGVKSGSPERWVVPVPHVAPVKFLLLKTRWQVINEERAGLW